GVDAFHYAAVPGIIDLHRALIKNAAVIMGCGEFELATTYAHLSGSPDSDPLVPLFRSRVEVEAGDLDEARSSALEAYTSLRGSNNPLRHLAHQNLISINVIAARYDVAVPLAESLVDSDAPEELRKIGRAVILAVQASLDGSLVDYERALRKLEREQRAVDVPHYLGITLLNSAVVNNARGVFKAASHQAAEACDLLRPSGKSNEL